MGIDYNRSFIINDELDRHLRFSRFSEKYVKELLEEILKYFNMDKDSIKLKENVQNECLTDVTAVVLGFGKYMVEGYKMSNKVIYDEINHRSIKKDRVGYLTYKDIKYVIKKMNKIRV